MYNSNLAGARKEIHLEEGPNRDHKLLFEAGLRADEPLTWSVLAIPPSWLYLKLIGRKNVILRFLSRDDCPQDKVKAGVQLKLFESNPASPHRWLCTYPSNKTQLHHLLQTKADSPTRPGSFASSWQGIHAVDRRKHREAHNTPERLCLHHSTSRGAMNKLQCNEIITMKAPRPFPRRGVIQAPS